MYIHVKVTPDSKKEEVERVNDTHFEISVREPAEQNRANNRVIEIMREQFPNAKRVRIASGHHSPSKLFAVDVPEEDEDNEKE